MHNRHNLKISIPGEEDITYHETKVEAMMSAEEEFWRDNPDEYDKYYKYELEEISPKKINLNTHRQISNNSYAMKPLIILLFIQYGVFVWIVYFGY